MRIEDTTTSNDIRYFFLQYPPDEIIRNLQALSEARQRELITSDNVMSTCIMLDETQRIALIQSLSPAHLSDIVPVDSNLFLIVFQKMSVNKISDFVSALHNNESRFFAAMSLGCVSLTYQLPDERFAKFAHALQNHNKINMVQRFMTDAQKEDFRTRLASLNAAKLSQIGMFAMTANMSDDIVAHSNIPSNG